MTLALLYDVHGNLPALDAVLADASAAGASRFLLGGDYAAFGAWPRETVERLRELDAHWIRGNVDRWTMVPGDAPEPVRPALAICRDLLGDEIAAELAALPPARAEPGVLYCHASPESDVDGFVAQPADGEEDLLATVDGGRVVVGHTHQQFRRTAVGGIELVNPGSVGIPLDGDRRAAYALVGEDGSLELRRVDYDHEASAAAVRERLGEAGEVFARRIEQARFDVG